VKENKGIVMNETVITATR